MEVNQEKGFLLIEGNAEMTFKKELICPVIANWILLDRVE